MRLSNNEWKVLEVLWRGDGLALGQVADALRPGTGWSRNTALTYLTRMASKGLVAIDKESYPSLYRAGVERTACQAAERRGFLERVYQGSTGQMVAAFLKEETLSPQERAELRKLLDEMEV